MATTARASASNTITTTTLFTPSSSHQTVKLQLHHRYSSATTSRSISSASFSSSRSSVCKEQRQQQSIPKKKQMCLCTPSTHPGSCRCKLHRSSSPAKRQRMTTTTQPFTETPKFPLSDGLALRRLALTNSLKKIGPVEGEVAMRFLAMRSQPRYRDQAFQPRPSSRLSLPSVSICS